MRYIAGKWGHRVSDAQKRKHGARERAALVSCGTRLDVARHVHYKSAAVGVHRSYDYPALGGLDLGAGNRLSANGARRACHALSSCPLCAGCPPLRHSILQVYYAQILRGYPESRGLADALRRAVAVNS